LPSNTEQAMFCSAAALSGSPGLAESGSEMKIVISKEGVEDKTAYAISQVSSGDWHRFSFGLGQYAGETITLHFIYSGPATAEGRAAFRYPCIELDLRQAENTQWHATPPAPSNTDLSPDFVTPGKEDLILDPNAPSLWTAHDMAPIERPGAGSLWQATGPSPWLEYSGPLDVDLTRFRTFFVRMQGPAEQIPGTSYKGDLYPSAVEVDLKTRDHQGFETSFAVPVVRDDAEHYYKYPLWKFGISGWVTGLRLIPQFGLYQGRHVARIDAAGFVAGRDFSAQPASQNGPGGDR
jgi:hypothetical protein